jgi:UDP-glucose 4-epimerase
MVFGSDYDTPDGTAIRDYINVTDLAKAHVIAVIRLLESRNLENPEIFNIGTGIGNSVLEIIQSFERSTGVKLNYEITSRRAGDVEKVWADSSKANKTLGWTPKISLDETVKSAWMWEKRLRTK